MMKVVLIFFFCATAIIAAPVLDREEGNSENNEIGDLGDVKEVIVGENRKLYQPQITSIQTIEEVDQINKICMEETKVDKKTVNTVLIDKVLPQDPKYKEFLACSYRKQKYLNEKGEIQFRKIITFLSKYYKIEDLNVLEVCGELKQTDNGADNALNTLKCILPKLLPLKEIFDE